MKKLIINSICLLIALISGVGLFVLKYQVKDEENTLNRIHREILKNKREIHMLEAEWAHLNDPQRLQELVAAQTNWQTIKAEQIARLTEIPMRPPMMSKEPISSDVSDVPKSIASDSVDSKKTELNKTEQEQKVEIKQSNASKERLNEVIGKKSLPKKER